ncbi:MAG: hypothetical protein ACLT1K_05325 [[Clostridium] leptum]
MGKGYREKRQDFLVPLLFEHIEGFLISSSGITSSWGTRCAPTRTPVDYRGTGKIMEGFYCTKRKLGVAKQIVRRRMREQLQLDQWEWKPRSGFWMSSENFSGVLAIRSRGAFIREPTA